MSFKYFDFKCPDERCENHAKPFESLTSPWEPVICPKCGAKPCEKQVTAHAGYHIQGDNSASRRPGHAGSFKRGNKT
jgi:hypothetical protein